MSWLAILIADVAEILVSKLGVDITTYFTKKAADLAAQKAIEDQAKASVIPLESAKTGDDVAKAAPGAFNGT